MIKLLGFLRKVITILELFSESFQNTIMNTIFSIAIQKVKQFSTFKNSNADNDEIVSDENYETLVTEIAETLARFSIALKSSIKESDIFILLNCSVPIIQKSALYLLQYYYENVCNLPNDIFPLTVEKIDEYASTKQFFPQLMIKILEKSINPVNSNDIGTVQRRKKKSNQNDL